MSFTVIVTILSLTLIGIAAAIILYFVAQKFRTYEDPRVDLIEEALPAVNCGGCGFPGCHNFADELVKAKDISHLFCPVGGNETMAVIAKILGKEPPTDKAPDVAVIRCSGSFEHRPRTNIYDGATSCNIASNLYVGETDCPYGCLGLGDCVDACDFYAIYMDEKTGLPVVIDDKCTACEACVKACPRDIIELRKKAKKDRKIFVSCINTEKGGIAKKYCQVACIGCKKCYNVCPHEAITMKENLAYIDAEKCKLCRKCPPVCPTNSILEINFPQKKEKQQVTDPSKKDKTQDSTNDTKPTGTKQIISNV